MKSAIIASLLFIVLAHVAASHRISVQDLKSKLLRAAEVEMSVSQKKQPSKSGGKGKDEFDYFVMAVSWSGTACKALPQPCSVPSYVNNFTAHGLWPNKNGTMGPFNCHDIPFDYGKISSLRNELDLYWTDYLKPEKHQLWTHEWEKHGTCAISVPETRDQYSYFTRTIGLVKAMNVLGALSSAGINPSLDKTHSLREVQEAFIRAYGAVPNVVCHQGKYLQELRFCMTKNFKPFTCYEGSGSNCGSTILFPPAH